jgi:hypothetical protein
MSDLQSNAKIKTGIHKISSKDILDDEDKNTIIEKILQTREVRQTIGNKLPDILLSVAGNSRSNKFIIKMLGKHLKKTLTRPDDLLNDKELENLFKNEEVVQELFSPLPELADGLFDILGTVAATIEKLPSDEKKEVIENLFSKLSGQKTGELITSLSRVINDIYKDDPEFVAQLMGHSTANFLVNIDFGELKEFFEYFTGDMKKFIEIVNDRFFDHPTKVVLLLNMVPDLADLIVTIANDIIGRFNEFPPDMAGDAVFNLMNHIDAKNVGKLVNELLEFTRKMNIGSALLGERSTPKFRQDIELILKEIIEQIDIDILWKFFEAVAQGKETLNHAMIKVSKQKPEMVMQKLRKAPPLKNYKIKMVLDNLSLLENLPEKKVVDSLTEGLSELDANSIAEIINISSVLINNIKKLNPQILPDLIGEMVNSIDMYECEDALKWVIDEIGTEFKPVGQRIMPHLIKALGEWMDPEDDEVRKDMDKVRETINNFLNNKEVTA